MPLSLPSPPLPTSSDDHQPSGLDLDDRSVTLDVLTEGDWAVVQEPDKGRGLAARGGGVGVGVVGGEPWRSETDRLGEMLSLCFPAGLGLAVGPGRAVSVL